MDQQRPTRQPPDKFGAPRGDSIGRLPQKYPIDRQRTSSSSEVRDHNGESWNGSLPSVFRDSRGPGVRKEGLSLSLMDSPIASRKQCRRIRATEAAFCAESVEDFEAPRLGFLLPFPFGPTLPAPKDKSLVDGALLRSALAQLLFWRPMSPAAGPILAR